MMEHREFFIPLMGDAALRVRYAKARGRVLRFAVQLEAYIEDTWTPITRYDNAHRFVHRDDLRIFQELNCPKNNRKILKQRQKTPFLWDNYFSGVA